MNYQALMRQVQNLQKEMLKTKEEIEKMEFDEETDLVAVKVNGKKEVLSVKLKSDCFDKEDIEILEDMIMVAVNRAFKEVDDVTAKKMDKYSSFAGLF